MPQTLRLNGSVLPGQRYGLAPKGPRIYATDICKNDEVRFSGVTNPPSEPDFDINQIVKVSEGSKASKAFISRVKASTTKVLQGFPAPLRKAMIAHGFEVVTFGTSPQELANTEYCFNQPLINHWLKRAQQDWPVNHELWGVLIDRGLQAHPESEPLKTAKNQWQKLSPTKIDESALSDICWHYINDEGPLYHREKRKVYLPEVVHSKSFFNVWPALVNNPLHLERVIRHEAAHFIDHHLGQSLFGGTLSDHWDFRLWLWNDSKRALDNHRFTDQNVHTIAGHPAYYYFPIQRQQVIHSQKSHHATESFAEILSAQYGGGACDPNMVNRVYPNTGHYIEERLRKLDQSRPLPLPPQDWSDKLDLWLSYLFGRLLHKD